LISIQKARQKELTNESWPLAAKDWLKNDFGSTMRFCVHFMYAKTKLCLRQFRTAFQTTVSRASNRGPLNRAVIGAAATESTGDIPMR
jgi:hypothetical protein